MIFFYFKIKGEFNFNYTSDFFFINMDVRANLYVPWLISRALKLTAMQASNNYHISNHRGQILWFQILITRSPTR